MLSRVLWVLVLLLLVLWVIGLVVKVAGNLIHLLLVVAAIMMVYNLVFKGRSRSSK